MDWKGSESLPIALSSDREQRPARLSYHLAFRRLLALATGVFFFVLYLQTPTICGKRPVRPFSLIATLPDLYEASVVELQAGMAAGHFTSVDLVRAYFARIDEVNLKGAALRAVLELNPSALFQAQVLDEERAMLGARGPLHGIPVLLKDNIATISSEGMNTTAGSYSLLGSVVPRDAGVVTRLRKAGAVILGKANLSQFSGGRGNVSSGWSARGGQSTSAYYLGGDPCGSSGGSGIAASIGLAAVTLGTETDGSITCPSSYNNLAGIKPTLGLTSRAGVIPLTSHQDTVGPICRSVSDAALVLMAMAGVDPHDNYTSAIPHSALDYTKALRTSALKGKRIGVPSKFTSPEFSNITQVELVAFDRALNTLRELGATVVHHADLESANLYLNLSFAKDPVMQVDFKRELNAYYAGLVSNPSGVRTIADLVAFNDAHPDLEKPTGYEDQFYLRRLLNVSEDYDAEYFRGLARNHDISRTHGIDGALKTYKLDALVLPASAYTTTPPAKAGYPIVTVPLGFYPDDTVPIPSARSIGRPGPGAPFGLSFIGTAWSEFELIGFAYAYEQKTQTRLKRKAYVKAIPKTQLVDVIGK